MGLSQSQFAVCAVVAGATVFYDPFQGFLPSPIKESLEAGVGSFLAAAAQTGGFYEDGVALAQGLPIGLMGGFVTGLLKGSKQAMAIETIFFVFVAQYFLQPFFELMRKLGLFKLFSKIGY